MGFFDRDSEYGQAHDEYHSKPKHEASITDELIAGAASFAAAKAFKDHQAKNGKVDNHATAKELLAGFAGAFIDREVETKGLDFIDAQKAKRHAKENTENEYRRHYEN